MGAADNLWRVVGEARVQLAGGIGFDTDVVARVAALAVSVSFVALIDEFVRNVYERELMCCAGSGRWLFGRSHSCTSVLVER